MINDLVGFYFQYVRVADLQQINRFWRLPRMSALDIVAGRRRPSSIAVHSTSQSRIDSFAGSVPAFCRQPVDKTLSLDGGASGDECTLCT